MAHGGALGPGTFPESSTKLAGGGLIDTLLRWRNKQPHMQQHPEDHLLVLPEVKKITKLSKSTIYNYNKKGGKYHVEDFPKRRKRGRRGVGWRASEVFAWVATRE